MAAAAMSVLLLSSAQAQTRVTTLGTKDMLQGFLASFKTSARIRLAEAAGVKQQVFKITSFLARTNRTACT